jgi:hypothetical protein
VLHAAASASGRYFTFIAAQSTPTENTTENFLARLVLEAKKSASEKLTGKR